MARIPCSFSAQEDFILEVDRRAASLGMKRSEYIVHALRMELAHAGRAMVIQANQTVSGSGNHVVGSNFPSPSSAHAGKDAKGPEGKRGSAKKKSGH